MNVDNILKNTDWKTGNNSLYGCYDDYFVKLLSEKPVIHDFLVNKCNSEITSCTPRFEEFHSVKHSKGGITYKFLYLFEKVDFVEIPEYFKEELSKDKIKTILSGVIYVFNKLNRNGFAFHDVCWKNICWNKEKDEVCIFDIDSVARIGDKSENLGGKGNPLFHAVFLNAKKKYGLNDLKFLDVCIITNMFFSFAVGLYYNDIDATFMRNQSENRVNKFISDVFDNNSARHDDEIYKIFKNGAATHLKSVLKEAENVSYITTLIDLVDRIPDFYTISKFKERLNEIGLLLSEIKRL